MPVSVLPEVIRILDSYQPFLVNGKGSFRHSPQSDADNLKLFRRLTDSQLACETFTYYHICLLVRLAPEFFGHSVIKRRLTQDIFTTGEKSETFIGIIKDYYNLDHEHKPDGYQLALGKYSYLKAVDYLWSYYLQYLLSEKKMQRVRERAAHRDADVDSLQANDVGVVTSSFHSATYADASAVTVVDDEVDVDTLQSARRNNLIRMLNDKGVRKGFNISDKNLVATLVSSDEAFYDAIYLLQDYPDELLKLLRHPIFFAKLVHTNLVCRVLDVSTGFDGTRRTRQAFNLELAQVSLQRVLKQDSRIAALVYDYYANAGDGQNVDVVVKVAQHHQGLTDRLLSRSVFTAIYLYFATSDVRNQLTADNVVELLRESQDTLLEKVFVHRWFFTPVVERYLNAEQLVDLMVNGGGKKRLLQRVIYNNPELLRRVFNHVNKLEGDNFGGLELVVVEDMIKRARKIGCDIRQIEARYKNAQQNRVVLSSPADSYFTGMFSTGGTPLAQRDADVEGDEALRLAGHVPVELFPTASKNTPAGSLVTADAGDSFEWSP